MFLYMIPYYLIAVGMRMKHLCKTVKLSLKDLLKNNIILIALYRLAPGGLPDDP